MNIYSVEYSQYQAGYHQSINVKIRNRKIKLNAETKIFFKLFGILDTSSAIDEIEEERKLERK